MMFQFSGNLLRYVEFHREVDVEGNTVEEGVTNLSAKFPGFGRIIHDSEGHIRMLHRIHLNGELLSPGNYGQPVAPEDVIGVLTPIAGG